MYTYVYHIKMISVPIVNIQYCVEPVCSVHVVAASQRISQSFKRVILIGTRGLLLST